MEEYEEGIAFADYEDSELSVASNSDTDSEADSLCSCSSEACSATPVNAHPNLQIPHNQENQNSERKSGRSWHNPSEILNLILKEAESSETVWTNDQHCSYLNSMEAAFVRNMFSKAYHAMEPYEEMKSRAQPRTSNFLPYSAPESKRFRSSVLSHTCNLNSSNTKKELEPLSNPKHAGCLGYLEDPLKRQPNSLEVPEVELGLGEFDFASHQPSPKNGPMWPNTSQVGFKEKEKSHKYQKQLLQHTLILEKAQHHNVLNTKVDLDQVVPSTYKIKTQLITDGPSPITATKTSVSSSNKSQVLRIQTAKGCS